MATTRRWAIPTYLQVLLALVLVVGILHLAKAVIVPLALAVLLTFVLTPIVGAVQHRGLGRVPAVLLTVVLAFTACGAAGWVVGLQVQRLAHELPTHRKEIQEKIASVRGAGGRFEELFRLFREVTDEPADTPAAAPSQVVLVRAEESSVERLANTVGPVLEPLATAALVVILVVFMLVKREDLRNRLIGLLGHGHLTGTTRVIVDAAGRVSNFLLSQLVVNVGFGVLLAVGLFLIGVPYAFLWGFLAAVLRFVPYIGTWIVLAFPLVLSIAIFPGWTQPVLVFAFFAVLDLVTANVVEPLFFGHSTGVSPVALLVAAAFWTWTWGPVGLVLSTPLTVCLVVLGQHVPRLNFLALLLSDEPPLEPHVSYYQRLLARDREEALAVARAYAEANGLQRTYDEVLLPALALARRDRRHGGLTAEDEAAVFDATRGILDQVAAPAANKADGQVATPAPTPQTALVLGCPAHHEAEELSLLMLARLLNQGGYRVDVISTKALSAEVESRVAAEQPALVFIAVLPPGGLVQAVYLCRRLRKRFPDLRLVVGYWGEDRDFDRLLMRLRSAGANYVTTSLAQGVTQVRATAGPAPAPAARVALGSGG
jgi:predicted PurR-regulated permease PerM